MSAGESTIGALHNQNSGLRCHYEVLDLRPGASSDDITRAVVCSLALVDGTALGGYAMLDPESAAFFRAEIDEARRVLLDATLRVAYDTDRGYPSPAASTSRDSANKGRTSSLPSLRILTPIVTEEESTHLSHEPEPPVSSSESVVAPVEPASTGPAVDNTMVPTATTTFAETDATATLVPVPVFDGQAIRGMREARGVTLEALAGETHIRRNILVAIEEMSWAELPERVFVRGFLTQIARVLRIEAKSLVDGYLAHDPRRRGT